MEIQRLALGLVGVGAIAEAIVTGLCEGGANAASIHLSPRSAARTDRLAARYPAVQVADSNQSVVDRADAVLVCVRPQEAADVLADLTFREEQPVISVMAGVPSRQLRPLVAPADVACLSIPKGSLTPPERAEIESHVTQTFRFLSKIPWTRDLSRVPEWAHAHHEKLDGSGYPRALRADAIPPQVRMLTICDIYDALAARDRPYKRAVEPERALAILDAEAARGALDGELLRIFVDAGIYRLIEEPGPG